MATLRAVVRHVVAPTLSEGGVKVVVVIAGSMQVCAAELAEGVKAWVSDRYIGRPACAVGCK